MAKIEKKKQWQQQMLANMQRNNHSYTAFKKAICLFPIKLNVPLPQDSIISFLDIYLKEMRNCVHIKMCTQMFTAPLFV